MDMPANRIPVRQRRRRAVLIGIDSSTSLDGSDREQEFTSGALFAAVRKEDALDPSFGRI
jgi:hypothetical protein